MIRRVMNNNALEIYEDDTLVMTLSERIKDGEMSVHISGAIKSTVAHELEDELMAAVSFCRSISVNMSQVTFNEVMAVFDESGFSDLLELRY